MHIGWLPKKWRVLSIAALAAVSAFHSAAATGEEGAPSGGDQPGAVVASQPAGASETESGSPAWESSPQPSEPQAGSTPQEQDAGTEPAGQESKAREMSGAAPDKGALAVFELQGLFIGMPLEDAKQTLDNLLGLESSVETDPQSGGLRVGVEGYAFVTGDDRQGVVRIEFFQKLIDALYQTEGSKSKDFVNTFSSTYNIPMDIDVTRRHTLWEGLTPDGLRVTITSSDSDDKVLVIEKR